MKELTKDKIDKLVTAGNGRCDRTGKELDVLVNTVIPALNKLIDICGGSHTGQAQEDTAYRVTKAWLEMTEGYTEDPLQHLKTAFDLDEGDKEVDTDDMVIVENLTVKSVCEHHVLPFLGTVHIGYIPNGKVLGLSKFARLVQAYSKRFQIQEGLTAQIAQAIMDETDAKGVIVFTSAVHTCMIARGVREHNSNTKTIATRGVFRNDKMLEEKFLTAIQIGGN